MTEELSTNENIPPDSEETLESSEPTKAAFTIVVQSWATPILSILMLVIGLLGGYYGRPFVESTQSNTNSDENPSVSSDTVVVPTQDSNLAAQQQELMALIVSQTRHFQGDPNAPVTIIEFSDFK
ncbi:MAG: hypothetical protein ISR58_04135 [Anaerolineales bacterium]|nr:hypothetical protein [Chloroflexota bacterium]MBL6980362.1 hypothetical protein [Anaerolineales bacterium]